MKHIFKTAAAAIVLAVSFTPAHAQDWSPPGPIQMMIGFTAGGGADTQARMIAEELQARHGWEIIPENVTGRGGLNLANEMLGGATDGTLIGMIVTETLGYNLAAATGAGMEVSDFDGLTTTAGFQMGIVAQTSRGWDSFEDMIAEAASGDVRFGVMSPRLADLAYLLGNAHDVSFNIVEVRGGRAVMDGVNAGDLDVGFMAGVQSRGVASGDLINLASALSQPLDQTPDAPTIGELGVEFNADGYFGFVAPAGMDEAARDAITAAIVDIITDPEGDTHQLLQRAFGGPTVIAGEAFDALLLNEHEQASALLAAASE